MSPNTRKKVRILLAGGGTGGHIIPGIALAKEFLKRENIDCLMVITSKEMDQHIIGKENLPYQALPIKGMYWGCSLKTIVHLSMLVRSFIRTWQIISAYAPDLIIGLGAYVSFPAIAIGRMRGITIFIQEQNLIPGRANLFLGRWADGIFTSFPETERYFPSRRVKMLGNPLRALPSQVNIREGKANRGLDPGLFTILVFGGSRGAHAINIRAMEAFFLMKSQGVSFQVFHQTGSDDCEEVAHFYKKEGIRALIRPFFDEMMDIYLLCDLVVSRSGAGTIAELTATGRPAILIPYPSAKADHQRINAMAMEDAGAARIILESHLTGEMLANEIMALMKDTEYLHAMARASEQLGRPHAAKAICDQAIVWFQERDKRGHAS